MMGGGADSANPLKEESAQILPAKIEKLPPPVILSEQSLK